ncbi:MAG: bifunctional phosphoglucose/phosphomannose isomerase [Bacteroidia bacterium]|jgi:glucose/mannose-6-phosphate isomerase|nr:bifunctional phosphoglucose/phosphomannose isomerase [Bacteroidia bacterium]MCC6767549.1 bifunctional phosphoglucose/phosphomannose isomerase [Bacteroidia bacterium]
MKDLIAGFPSQLKEAVRIFQNQQLPLLPRPAKQVLISGLGGSGIGGTIVAAMGQLKSPVPMWVVKDYALPAWVNPETLVIISSYSGGTEETLETLKQAIQTGAMIICISSGGEVQSLATEHQIHCIQIPGGKPPRACLGYSLTQLFGIVDSYGIIPGLISEMQNGIRLLETEQEAIKAEAEAIARSISFSMPAIYSTPAYEGVAIRLRQQLNENAKMLCWNHVVPEMNHNELVGWAEKQPKIAALFLRNEDDYYRNARRMEICREIIQDLAGRTLEIFSKGENYTERLLYWIHLGDWISWFASVERNRDAMEINVINRLKGELSNLP